MSKQISDNLELDIFMRLPFDAVKRKYLKDLDIIKEIKLSADENFVYCGKRFKVANGDWKQLASRAFLFKHEKKCYSLVFITLVYGTRYLMVEHDVFGIWSTEKEFDDWLNDGDDHD